jgi:TfoX/Sxy family transcriptional regulator of competence genes
MGYDEGLAERIRGLLEERPAVTEQRMFGGLAFLIRGHMTVGIVKDELMVRVGADAHADVIREPAVRPMDFTGRPLKGFVLVAADGIESDADLERWVERGVAFAASLPAKGAPDDLKPKKKRKQASRSKTSPRG